MTKRVTYFVSRSRAIGAAIPVGVAVLAILAGCDRFASADERVARAQTQFDAGFYSAAMRDAKLVLDKEPDNVKAHVMLARVSLRLGDPDTASKELERAATAGADAGSIRDLHYQVLLAQRKFEDLSKELAADTATPAVTRLVLTAKAQSALGHEDEAGKAIDQALAQDPKDIEAALAHVRWLQVAGRPDEAKQAVNAVLEAHPDLSAAAALRARMKMAGGDIKGAIEDFDRARKTALKQLDVPDQLAILAGQVEAELELGDATAAEPHLNALHDRIPDAFVTYYLKARLALLRKDVDTATDLLRDALARQPDSVPARLLLSAALLEQGSTEQADAELSKLLAEHPESTEARKLLAKVYVARSDLAGAKRVLEQGPADGPRDSQIDWMSGSIRLMTGQTDEAIALLETSAAANPRNTSMHLDLAQAHLMAGHIEQAQKVLRALPAADRGKRGAQLLVLADVSGKDPAEAQKAIARIVAESPKDASVLVACGLYLLQAGHAADATDLFTRAIAADAKNTQARFGLAAAAMQRGDTTAADAELRKIIAAEPANERAYLGLASLAARNNDRARARTWLEQAIGANPSAVDSRLRLAEMAFADKDKARGDALLEQALKVSSVRANTLRDVGTVLMGASRFSDALQRFNDAASAGLKGARIDAANALLKLDRVGDARSLLESIVREKPDAPAPNGMLVRLDVTDKHYDQALARIAAFEKAGGAQAAVLSLRAQTLEAAGRKSEAAQAYERLAKVQPSSAAVVKIYSLRQGANQPSSEAVLVDWLKTHSQDVAVRSVLAQHYQLKGDRAAAIAQYEQAQRLSKTPELLNNLAWLYFEAGDARALEMARSAYNAAPANAEIADTYGWILLTQGKPDEAVKILETAARAVPAVPDVQFHYAAALARTGKKQEAATTLRKLLAEARTFPTRREAETLLNSLT